MIDGKLTYISLFSSAGVGCFGFKQEDFICVATNEYIERRLNVQKYNNKCNLNSGYILGDITKDETMKMIFNEIESYRKLGNDGIDVLIATPPCQGMSVANHKKHTDEIKRNSLVVESIELTKRILPRFFLFENVSTFLTTGCTAPNGEIKEIKNVINEELSDNYQILAKVLNFKNYGSNSSRTRTLVIGVRKDYQEYISPIDLFPDYTNEKNVFDVIGDLKSLKWNEIDENDILHAFRTYPEEMRSWIHGIKEGMSAFDNEDINKRPHKVVDGKIVVNVNKNGDKYTRQYWNKVAPCIHTRNDQLASQNTIHPNDDRVFSIRELMRFMTIPDEFKWSNDEYEYLNNLSLTEKHDYYKKNEIKIRQSIGEAVPTIIFRQIANKIKNNLLSNNFKLNIENTIDKYKLNNYDNLINFINSNPYNYSTSLLSKISEMANLKRFENDAYYTNKTLLNEIYNRLPNFEKDEINIIEPSVGTGNFLPYIFKKYENINKIYLDVIDIDSDSLNILKALLKKYRIPNNVKVNYINDDFLKHKFNRKYDLVIGNPPFTKVNRNYLKNVDSIFNDGTTNLCALFLEKSILLADYVCMIQPKYVLNTVEFNKTREYLSNYRIETILDFGENGFKGVLIETICFIINTIKKPKNTFVKHLTFNIENTIKQEELTSNKYPYWLLYRDEYFSSIEKKLEFNMFNVFRDRQISNKDLVGKKEKGFVRVVKSRNISNNGKIISINDYDSYIDKNKLINKTVYKFYNDLNVFLVPNMTYNPRMIRNRKNITVNGSVAILIPKNIELTQKQIDYFASDEFRKFYRVARNYQTRSLNIDETSVFFFGILKGE